MDVGYCQVVERPRCRGGLCPPYHCRMAKRLYQPLGRLRYRLLLKLVIKEGVVFRRVWRRRRGERRDVTLLLRKRFILV